MARSYFSRILHGAGGPALAPPRPVSNLWKSVRIDSMAVEAPQETASQVPYRSSRRRAAAAAEPENEPVVSRAFETKPEPHAAVPVPPRQAPTSSQPFQEAAGNAPREGHVVRPVDGPANSRTAQVGDPVEPGTARSHVPRAAPRNDVAPKPDRGVSESPEPAPSQQQAMPSERPRQDLRPQHAPARAVPARPDTKPQAPVPAPMAQPGNDPVRHREPSAAWNTPPQEEPRAAAAPMAQSGHEPLRHREPNAAGNNPPQEEPRAAAAPLPQARIQPARNREPDAAWTAPLQEPPEATAPFAKARIEPVRHREPAAAWNTPPREEPGAAAKNSVHIGKIEVQVVSPPAPVRYAAPPVPPKGRLARGYALWSTWQ